MTAVGTGAASVELTATHAVKRAPPGIASARLWHSCARQKAHASQHVRTPDVSWEAWDGGAFAYGMERITDWLHPLQQPGQEWLMAAAATVAEACTGRWVSGATVQRAVSSKLAALHAAGAAEHSDTYRAAIASCGRAIACDMPAVPLGQPHGDFTTCNMLLRGSGELFVIDYLDSEVQSPVVDVAKLRQDTRWGWAAVHGVATPQAAGAADRWWVERWCAEPWWAWVPPLTALAMLRAVPYVRDATLREWLVGQAREACVEAECRTPSS